MNRLENTWTKKHRMMNNPSYFFLLGIPGCGKSEIYRRLSNRLKEEGFVEQCDRFDDHPILWDYFQENGPKTEPCDDGGYVIVDDSLWDDVLRDLDEKCRRESESDSAVFLEFARSDNLSALENFSDEVMDNAVILYIYCPFELAWQRNVQRHEESEDEGSDDHLVSREEMESTYGDDDHEKLLTEPPVPAVRINNDENDFEKLEREIDQAFDEIRDILSPSGA